MGGGGGEGRTRHVRLHDLRARKHAAGLLGVRRSDGELGDSADGDRRAARLRLHGALVRAERPERDLHLVPAATQRRTVDPARAPS
jgi:hypothetical protein